MLVARLFIISPLWAAYFCHETYHGPLHEEMSFSTLLICSAVAYLLLCWWDCDRAPRSAISVIMRNMAISFCVVYLVFIPFGMGWFFWYMLAHSTVWVIVFWQLVTHGIAHIFIYPFVQSDYHAVRKAGWHPFWDVTAFNTDSDLIKDGGFAEPTYEGFVPPDHFRYQCPRCLVRVEHSFGVCWNCSYGSHPGDEKEYYERWGN